MSQLSTRTLYGVYLQAAIICYDTNNFQLALTTECIELWQHALQILGFSTRTHYGMYQLSWILLLFSSNFQLALTTECICKMA